jgi:hypothetical protein
MTTETPDYMQAYADRWAEVVQNKDGTLNLDAVARELADYDMLTDRVTEVYLAVTAERIGGPCARAQAVIDIVNERIDEAGASVNRWWITTAPLPAGGEKVLGPFESEDLAMKVRGRIDTSGVARYWVDDEDPGAES